MTANIGVVGAGRTGSGIAEIIALAGFDVVLVDAEKQSLNTTLKAIVADLNQHIASGKLTLIQETAIICHITTGTDYALLRDCRMCIEAVPANADMQTDVQRKIRTAAPDAIIATNSLTLPIADFASHIAAPDKLVGMIFDFPPQTGANVTIVSGPQTSESTVDYVTAIVHRLGKAVILGTQDSLTDIKQHLFQTPHIQGC